MTGGGNERGCGLPCPSCAILPAPVEQIRVLYMGNQVQQGYGSGVVPVKALRQQGFEDRQGDFPHGGQAVCHLAPDATGAVLPE